MMTTLERLQEEYREADLHPRHNELVTEEEVFILLNHEAKIWPIAFWTAVFAALTFLWVVGR
jgi:hypothetical protein